MVINNSTTSAKMAQSDTGSRDLDFGRVFGAGGEGSVEGQERSVFFKI